MLRSYLDGRLFADAFSDAPPVVALHGWARSRQDLTSIVEPFAGASIDLPGCGASPDPTEPGGAEAYAGVVAEAIEELGICPVVLGHSMGGRIAVCLAATRPELVSGLVLTGAPLLRPRSTSKSPLAFRVAKRLHGAGVLSDAVMERQRNRYGSADYRAARGVMRSVLVTMVNEDYRAQLTAIRCPVEMVWGADDTAAPVEMAREAAALIARSHLVVLPGIGHDTPRDAAPDLIDAVARTLALTV